MPRPDSDAVRQKANRRRQESRDALAGALRRCRLELHQVLPDGGLESARPIVATFARWAHDEAVPPERVLPVFKEMIAGLSVFKTSDPQNRGELMFSLVQMVIEGYYAES